MDKLQRLKAAGAHLHGEYFETPDGVTLFRMLISIGDRLIGYWGGAAGVFAEFPEIVRKATAEFMATVDTLLDCPDCGLPTRTPPVEWSVDSCLFCGAEA